MGIFGKSEYDRQLEVSARQQADFDKQVQVLHAQNEETARQLEASKLQQAEAARSMELTMRQYEETERQLEVSKALQIEGAKQQREMADIMQQSVQNHLRHTKLLEAWEEHTKRFDALLAKWEQKPTR